MTATDAPAAGTHSSAAPLEFRNVTKRYPGTAAPAIDDLSFTVPAGEVCVLVGPSGCGKTTAMRLVNRMIDLTSGDILIDGNSVLGRSTVELRRQIGYVIQQVGLFPHVNILHNITMVPRLLGWDRKRIEQRGEELLELIGLTPEMGRRFPSQLSGGQRQRVGVARALAADPPLMLMDEPFGAIDPINRERLQNEFLRLQHEIAQDDRLRHPRHRRSDQDGRPDRDPARGRGPRAVRHAGPHPRQARRTSSSLPSSVSTAV